PPLSTLPLHDALPICPWNRKAAEAREPTFAPADLPEPQALLALDDAAFRERFRHTALWRARRSGLLRNAAIVLGNRGDVAAVPRSEEHTSELQSPDHL